MESSRVITTLQDLVRFDTTNPPGNEAPAAQYIRSRLAAEGIESTILESAPGRANVIARLRGDGSERPFLLLSHLDVVAVEPERWSHPPFAAEIADGSLWGRGTLDMKGFTAVQLEILLELKRRRLPLKRDVILAAVADEETGGKLGAGWLVENHFNLLDAEYALNEGGGQGYKIGDRWLFTCQTAEKAVCWTRVRARGVPGHASTPPFEETAVAKLVAALDRLAHARLPQRRVPTVESFVQALCELLPPPQAQDLAGIWDPDREERALAALPDKGMAKVLRASLRNTATPTVLRAGSKTNVIPSTAEAEVDFRMLPGVTPAEALAEMRAYLGDDVETEVIIAAPTVENAFDTPLFEVIRQVTSEFEPHSIVTPFMSTGGTDSRYLTARGVKVYGFFPGRYLPGEPGPYDLFHAHDERISLANLRFASDVIWEIVRRVCVK